MREIKFRALNKNNEFIYGLPYTDGVNETAYFKEYNNRLCWRRESDGASCNQPYKNGTLSQYTGLKDKNGTEIYESDILECQDWDGEKYVTEVKFGDGAFYIEVNGCDYDYTVIGWAIRQDIDECCVIGNIYENPELLK